MKNKILDILELPYINGSNICLDAGMTYMKWQNVKRGYDKDFTESEKEKLKKVFYDLQQTLYSFLKYKNERHLKEILNNKYIILKPLIKTCTHAEYDRILRFKRGEADLYINEHKILSEKMYMLHQKLIKP